MRKVMRNYKEIVRKSIVYEDNYLIVYFIENKKN